MMSVAGFEPAKDLPTRPKRVSFAALIHTLVWLGMRDSNPRNASITGLKPAVVDHLTNPQWAMRDLNPRPPGYEPGALPTELTAQARVARSLRAYSRQAISRIIPAGFEPVIPRFEVWCFILAKPRDVMIPSDLFCQTKPHPRVERGISGLQDRRIDQSILMWLYRCQVVTRL